MDIRERSVETNLYYLTSRYYNPKWGRFIQSDTLDYLDPQSINGVNLYAYCGNDPVNYVDPSGHIAISTIVLLTCIGVGMLVGGTYSGITAYNDGARGWELVGWTALGAVVGGIIGGIVGYFAGPIAANFFSYGTGTLLLAGGMVSSEIALTGTMAGTLVTIGATGLSTIGALAGSGVLMFAKTSRQSGKATSSDKPSWINESMVDPKKSAQENARDALNWKYGPGNWPKGPGTEYSKIVKWFERYLRYYRGW